MDKCSRCGQTGKLPYELRFPDLDIEPYGPVRALMCSLRCTIDAAEALDQGQRPTLAPAPSTIKNVERDGSGNITRIIETAA